MKHNSQNIQKPSQTDMLLLLPIGLRCRVDCHIGEVVGYSLDDNIVFHTLAFVRDIIVSPYIVEVEDNDKWIPAFSWVRE